MRRLEPDPTLAADENDAPGGTAEDPFPESRGVDTSDGVCAIAPPAAWPTGAVGDTWPDGVNAKRADSHEESGLEGPAAPDAKGLPGAGVGEPGMGFGEAVRATGSAHDSVLLGVTPGDAWEARASEAGWKRTGPAGRSALVTLCEDSFLDTPVRAPGAGAGVDGY